MKVLGIALRRPSFNELTAAMVMGTGLWVAGVGLGHALRADLDRYDAGALLLVIVWGCLSARLGIRVGQGLRHLAVNLCVGAALLLAYEGGWSLLQ